MVNYSIDKMQNQSMKQQYVQLHNINFFSHLQKSDCTISVLEDG